MKRLKEVPAEVLDLAKSAHERAIGSVLAGYQHYVDMPVRPVRMRIMRQSRMEDALEMTIIPATSIFVRKNGFFEDGSINRDDLTYSVVGTKTPFPFGHIYKDSGHVCLGTIFVPARIPANCPAQPLETLFLHNDRNTGHGNAMLKLSRGRRADVTMLLRIAKITFSPDLMAFDTGENLIRTDALWVIGAEVYKQKPFFEALALMQKIYEIIFKETKV